MNTEKTTIVVVEVETAPGWLTAEEARAITDARRRADVEKFFPLVIKDIRSRAEAGGCTAFFEVKRFDFTATADEIAKRLKDLGYAVSVTHSYINTQW